jgi:hypothetical protein
MADRSTKPAREVISASIPAWKKRLIEAVGAKRGDRTTSATVEHALDNLLREHRLLEEEAA